MNNMMFNSDKFELVRYKNKASKQMQSETSYASNVDSIIEETQHIRDVSVTLPNNGTFIQLGRYVK